MGWGEPKTATSGAGSTGQIEDAHRAFDAVQIPGGTLAVRALTAAGVIDQLRQEIEAMRHA